MKSKTIRFLAGRLPVVAAITVCALVVACAAPTPQQPQAPQANAAAPEQESAITPEPQKEETTMEQGMTMVTFPSADGLNVTADLYWTGNNDAPFIILFHQARYSRGEYLEITPKLNALGYNCLAVDQRSGDSCNGVINETARTAKEKNLPVEFVDAYPDLEAALQYVTAQYAPK